MKYNASDIQTVTMVVPLNTESVLSLSRLSVLEGAYTIDLSSRRTSDTRSSLNKSKLVNDTVFDASFLTLRQGSKENVIEKLPFESLSFDRFTRGERLGYPIEKKDISFENSSISIETDSSNYGDKEVFELVVRYIPKEFCR